MNLCTLKRINSDITNTLQYSKSEILENCINNRLNKCQKTYEEEIETAIQYLYRRDEMNVLRKLNSRVNGKV